MKRYRAPGGRQPVQKDVKELQDMLTLAGKELDNLMEANTSLSFELNKVRIENQDLQKKIMKLEKRIRDLEAAQEEEELIVEILSE